MMCGVLAECNPVVSVRFVVMGILPHGVLNYGLHCVRAFSRVVAVVVEVATMTVRRQWLIDSCCCGVQKKLTTPRPIIMGKARHG